LEKRSLEYKQYTTDLEKEAWSASKILMSIKNTTFKYEEYKIAVERAYDDVVLALNLNEEIEIVEC